MPAPSDSPALVARMIARGLVHPPPPDTLDSLVARTHRKRDAAYGTIWDRIRDIGRTRRQFSRDDFPGLDRTSVERALRHLCRAGEIRVCQHGGRGRAARPTIYSRA